MSYIINNTSAYASIKLTEKGRERLALGQLNFAYWAIGDSEINYDREQLYDDSGTVQIYANVSGATRILRPKDQQPNFKSFITTDNATNLQAMQPANIEVIKAVVNNAADERGFFNHSGTSFTTLSSSTYMTDSQMVSSVILTGGTELCISGLTYDVGDRILINYTNPTFSSNPAFSNSWALPNLWYQVEASGSCMTVDRLLPDFSGYTGMCQVMVYPNGEVWDIYGSSAVPYWDNGTLSFDSCCNVSCSDVPIWNQNNVWCEDPAGFTSGTTYEHYWDFGSFDYLGQKYPYLWYACEEDPTSSDIICETPGQSVIDSVSKSVGILHYTNNVVSNVYGEFFYIDNDNGKTVTVEMPDLMYHRRNFATASGVTMGMTFLASGDTQLIPNSEIEYVPLIEDPTMVTTSRAVGKVFPQLKTVVFDDDEIVMATSAKANRNWTLPALAANIVAPQSGGTLETDKTMYLTYILDNEVSGGTSGMTTGINCQYYTKITNTTPTTKDVNFRLNAVDLLPYMRKIEHPQYDGLGFHAYNFRVLWQIVDEPEDRPLTDAWSEFNFTTSAITAQVGETIDPTLLEAQNPLTNGFLIDDAVVAAAVPFVLVPTANFNFPLNVNPSELQLGDEKFFYGNIEAHIGATIFKTLFKVNIEASDFAYTSNPTRGVDPNVPEPDIRISEIGVYDSDQNLVVVAKMSKPMLLSNSNTINAELSIDF